MIYFDYASSTPVDEEILDSYDKLCKKYFANPSAIHLAGLETNALLEKSREQIAQLLHCKSNEVIFTSGASESNNLAIKGVCFKYANRGKHIITSKVEHSSVLNVFKQLHDEFGYEIDFIDVKEDGSIDQEKLFAAIREDTILVSLMFVNNETGAINDIASIAAKIKKDHPKTFFHCDGTQGIGKIELDISNVDLLSMSAHKIYGLKGSGFLIKKENVSLSPLIIGGGQEGGLRAGTSNFAVDVVLAKALRLAFEQMQTNYNHVKSLRDELVKSLEKIDTISINSPLNGSPYILNISVLNKKSAIILAYLQERAILVSASSACGAKKNVYSYVIEDMYPDSKRSYSAIRISFSKFNTIEEIRTLANVLKTISENIK